jgi:alpha-tubulin suppressor-like RCC1 family protein
MKRSGRFLFVMLLVGMLIVLTACGDNGDGGNGGNRGTTDKAITISVGSGHSLMINCNGGLWAWGWNDCGQLGDGTSSL